VAWEADSSTNNGYTPSAPTTFSVVAEQDPSDQRIWEEAYGLMELRQRLTETEARYLLRSGQMLTTEQAMALLGAVVQVIKKYVTDPTVLTQLAQELRLLGRAGAPNFSGGRG
jgi:hypothetical protein